MDSFGIESPGKPHPAPHRPPARHLVLIEAGGAATALLFTEARALVGEFDAGSEEVAVMTRGLTPTTGATGPEWDAALRGQGPAERAAAVVYKLDI